MTRCSSTSESRRIVLYWKNDIHTTTDGGGRAGAFALAGNAVAMTKAEIKAENNQIAAQLKSDQPQCKSLKANAKDICVAEAKGANKVAKAEFEARQKDTPKPRYNVRIAKAEAGYAVAKVAGR